MRKLIVQELISVDGFAAAADGDLGFFDTVTDYSEVDQENLRILRDVDVVVLGASTYRMFVEYGPTAEGEMVAEMVNTIPKLIFSSTLDQAPWGEWEPAQVVRGDPVDEISALKRRPGRDIMVWGSLSIARSLIRAGLVDELQLRVCPVAIGTGTGLFPDGFARLDMELIEAKPFKSGIVALRYHTRRS